MSLCTLEQVKRQLSIPLTDETDDTVLGEIIDGVSAQLARAAGRVVRGAVCLEKTTLVETHSIPESAQWIWLAAWPIVAVTEVKEASLGGFDDVDALVENEGFQIDIATGGLARVGRWLYGVNTVRISYTGGFTPPDVYLAQGYQATAGEINLPDDLQAAAAKQVAFYSNRRSQLGVTSMSAQGGSIATYAKDDLLPDVLHTIERFRRMTG